MKLGEIGIWTSHFESQPWPVVAEAVAELDELGYAAVWFPESRGREALSQSALLLSASKRIVVAPGIASIYARDAMAMAAGQRTLAEAFPGRYLLGIGVSHAPMVEQLRGHRYERPYSRMVQYLDAMEAAPYAAPAPDPAPSLVLAALGPRMLRLAAQRTLGAHPYFVPVEHTRLARQTMGSAALLAPEQVVVLERDPARARAIARQHTVRYLAAANYANNLRRLGYGEDELVNGGSDRLVDDIVAWGGIEAAVGRVRAHLDAGADHVCIQVFTAGRDSLPREAWRDLAQALLT